MTTHRTPWSVAYYQRFDDWHEKSCPRIVDADGGEVPVGIKLCVAHPGIYDPWADALAHQIVDGVNTVDTIVKTAEVMRMPMLDVIEGFTQVMAAAFEANGGWSTAIPTEPGDYWFYGNLHLGSMGEDYRIDRIEKPRLTRVTVKATANSLIGVGDGQIIFLDRFEPDVPFSKGVRGYWKQARLPELPTDTSEFELR